MKHRREEKLKLRLAEAVGPKAKLSTDKGRIDRTKYHRPNDKDRRHSGRTVVYSDDEDYPIQIEYYDDWSNYRDSQRDINGDDTRIKKYRRRSGWRFDFCKSVEANNKKIKRMEEIKNIRRQRRRWKENKSGIQIAEFK
ncbi:hypothetical protein M0R04_08865 [Candidatus Dojkabacteria bacterium]|jgi:hypothetical protein|nr:hypothetical protein [Candidatus Dojkabacteria bacterium]